MHSELLEKHNIYLVGLMGSGKTTVGRKLAKRLKAEFVDTDQAIEQRSGVSIGRIFDIEGEQGFRVREQRFLEEIAGQSGKVVSTGGGIVLSDKNREIMLNSGICIYLQANFSTLWGRLRDCKRRPLLQKENPEKIIQQLLIERAPLYESIAHISVQSGQRSANVTINKILSKLEQYEQEHC